MVRTVLIGASLELALLWRNLLGEDDRHASGNVGLIGFNERTVMLEL